MKPEPRYPKLVEIAHKLEGVKYGSRPWRRLMTQLDFVTAQESMRLPNDLIEVTLEDVRAEVENIPEASDDDR
jgi:hypothetical protein